MSRYNLKIAHYQEPKNYNLKKKWQSTDTNTKMNQMLELSDQNSKAAIINIQK